MQGRLWATNQVDLQYLLDSILKIVIHLPLELSHTVYEGLVVCLGYKRFMFAKC